MKITSSRINTLLTIGENLNIEFKRAGDGPKADTFESGVRNLYRYVKIYSNAAGGGFSGNGGIAGAASRSARPKWGLRSPWGRP